jgi:4-hydroxybenzoate polyprenyltransferase
VSRIQSILRFVKVEHTLFSLPLIYSGVYLAAPTPPSAWLLVLVLLGAVGARTAALSLNRIIDREIDKRNPRTIDRELPSGRLRLLEAIAILAVSLVFYLFSAAAISDFCLRLSALPLIVFTLYPYLKRFTMLAHFGVGLGLAMAPMGGWFAVHPTFVGMLPGVLLSLFTLLWVSGFDIIYSTLDEMFDRDANLYSFSSRLGKERALLISAYLHAASFVALGALFVLSIHTVIALPFLALSGFLLFLEHRKAEDVELAFFRINAVLGFSVFGMVVIRVVIP